MKILEIAFLSLLLAPGASVACSIPGNQKFVPSLERWTANAGPGQLSAEGPYWEPIPQPKIVSVEISRATHDQDNSCGDAGLLKLELSLPEESTYKIDDFGAYFRVVQGELPDQIFPDIPLKGIVYDGTSRFTFVWLDSEPATQEPLDIVLDIFFVTHGLNVGSVTKIEIREDAG